MRKRIVTSMVIMMLLLGNTFSVFAATVSFDKAYVEGESYSYVTRKDKTSSNAYVEITVNKMFTTNNAEASYKKSKAQLRGWNGKEYVCCVDSADYGKTVTKGTAARFHLLKDYRKSGKTVKYYAKGNNPSVDCKISGVMKIDQE